LVIGEFLGDDELVLYSLSQPPTRRILIALPLDDRGQWPVVATDLADFLDRFQRAGGDKYWESETVGS
jgi:hypothetical protein